MHNTQVLQWPVVVVRCLLALSAEVPVVGNPACAQ